MNNMKNVLIFFEWYLNILNVMIGIFKRDLKLIANKSEITFFLFISGCLLTTTIMFFNKIGSFSLPMMNLLMVVFCFLGLLEALAFIGLFLKKLFPVSIWNDNNFDNSLSENYLEEEYMMEFKKNFKRGRAGLSEHKYYSLFYSMISKNYPSELPLLVNNNMGQFYTDIAERYKINKSHFANTFPGVHSTKTKDYLEENPEFKSVLLSDERLNQYPDILNLIKEV